MALRFSAASVDVDGVVVRGVVAVRFDDDFCLRLRLRDRLRTSRGGAVDAGRGRGRAAVAVVDGHGLRAAFADVGDLRTEQRRPRLRVHRTGDRQPGARLEALHSAAGDRSEDPVVIDADGLLDGGHGRALVAVLDQGARGERDGGASTLRRLLGRRGAGTTGRRDRGERCDHRPGGHRRRHGHRRALAPHGVLARRLGDLAPVHGPPQRPCPQLRVHKIAVIGRYIRERQIVSRQLSLLRASCLRG